MLVESVLAIILLLGSAVIVRWTIIKLVNKIIGE